MQGVLDTILCDKVCVTSDGPSWPWLYGSSNYMCNQFLSGTDCTCSSNYHTITATMARRKSHTLYHIILYRVHLTWMGLELTTLVEISTDWIGGWKSNYHTIMTRTTPVFEISLKYFILFLTGFIWAVNLHWLQGRIQGGAHTPPKIGKNMIFGRKIVIFHTK
jgi:hypothetical protein